MPKESFAEWMKKVDAALLRKCGLESRDLPDFLYRDAYDRGESAGSTASQALKAASF